ncbi:unnamed protein product, partial [Urochloa humidicola]
TPSIVSPDYGAVPFSQAESPHFAALYASLVRIAATAGSRAESARAGDFPPDPAKSR